MRFVLILAAAAALTAETVTDPMLDRANAFAEAYNSLIAARQAHKWDLRQARKVQRLWRDLQELPEWPRN